MTLWKFRKIKIRYCSLVVPETDDYRIYIIHNSVMCSGGGELKWIRKFHFDVTPGTDKTW